MFTVTDERSTDSKRNCSTMFTAKQLKCEWNNRPTVRFIIAYRHQIFFAVVREARFKSFPNGWAIRRCTRRQAPDHQFHQNRRLEFICRKWRERRYIHMLCSMHWTRYLHIWKIALLYSNDTEKTLHRATQGYRKSIARWRLLVFDVCIQQKGLSVAVTSFHSDWT